MPIRISLLLLLAAAAHAQSLPPLRPPAVPLIAHDPYFSIWSMSDHLTDEPTRHWTGTEQPLAGIARIDGAAFRFLGSQPRDVPAMEQRSLELTPTRTAYAFEAAGVRIAITFLTPALPQDLEILSRPLTYVTFEASATDGRTHQVSLWFDASSQIAVNIPEQRVNWSRVNAGSLTVLRAGTAEQPLLSKSGDNLRIDWGHLYLAVPPQQGSETLVTNPRNRTAFARTGKLPDTDELEPSRQLPVLGVKFDLGGVSRTAITRRVLVAYDDQFSIQYFQRNLRPYWRRNGMDAAGLLTAAARDYESLAARCRRFDEELTADLVRTGGANYASIAITAYRQTLAAHKLVADMDGTPLYFSKENFSNGSIDTVDVTYPSAPFFLLLNPQLLKAQIRPILDYARLPRWPWPYAPHDLGTYPLANGQTYGGGERSEENQMPVEESGNMIILAAALAKAEGNASFAAAYWPTLARWADYLRQKGLDPENQLCTDDFAGHLAHNTNLSIKAVVALDAFAGLASEIGKTQEAATYRILARDMAAKWVSMAAEGDHYRLAFDKPGTWSQKYNLVWDRLLGLELFPPEIARKEIAYYLTRQNTYGLPLDNRETYTKLDWIVWTATLAPSQSGFEALIAPVARFLNETPTRVPMTDWYWTLDGKQRGFQARSVVGGVYIKMLSDPAMWKKWTARGAAQSPSSLP